jgi:mycothiol synthase
VCGNEEGASNMAMALMMRRYNDDDDYWRIRQFLRDVAPGNRAWDLNWAVYRFDYCRWHAWENIEHPRLPDVVFLWETPDGGIAAVLHPEGRGEAFLQVDPVLRTSALETAMLATAEVHLAEAGPDGRRRLTVWANEHDKLLRQVLVCRGYRQDPGPEYQRRRSLDLPILQTPAGDGYTVRALGDGEELPARSWASWWAFHPHEPDGCYRGWEWYRNIQRAPLYRRDLDLVAVAAGGEIAAFCTVWFDDVVRTAAFEPVGTVPEHQRRGLARAVMSEGLRRARHLGATVATVGSYSPPAHALYSALGFTDYAVSHPWVREW